jgi:peptide/nickel transport system permease protein
MRLAKIILLRLLYGVLTLLFVSFVVFIINEIAPGGPEYILAGEKATAETIQRIRHEHGWDRPWPVRYVETVYKASHLDFGNSLSGTKQPVITIIADGAKMTARLAIYAILLASIVGIILGIIGAVYQHKWPDKLVLGLSTLGVTIPNFVLAPILAYFFALKLHWLPLTWEHDRVIPDFYYLVLPVSLLALRPCATITRSTRATMIDVLQQEYIRFAIAKGVPALRLIFKHALRNAILPVFTIIGLSFGFLLTGSFTIEIIFNIPGIGMEGVEAIRRRDSPVVMAIALAIAAMFTLINLIVDLILPMLDPRIREVSA